MPKSKNNEHIEDMLEWEEKQYTPWEYAQEGKLPPVLKAEGNKKLAAILYFVLGGIFVLAAAGYLLSGAWAEFADNWPTLLITPVLAVLCLMAAANYLRKWKAEKLLRKKARLKKK